jgi:hypothetical protein
MYVHTIETMKKSLHSFFVTSPFIPFTGAQDGDRETLAVKIVQGWENWGPVDPVDPVPWGSHGEAPVRWSFLVFFEG